MSDVLVAWLFRLLAHLPLPALHNLGGLAGWLAWLASPAYRRRVRDNLALAGLAGVRGAAIAEAGKAALELPYLWLRPHADIAALVVRVSGAEVIEAAHAARQGVLFLTPHIGCFEIAAAWYAARWPITVLYRAPKQRALAPLIEQGRGSRYALAPADMGGVRRLLKALRGGQAAGMLPDQVPGTGEGVWAPFFGRPAYTMTLAARLGQTGARVVIAYAERLPYGAGYHLHLFEPAQPLDGDLVTMTAQINREMETVIRRCPAQYFWGYNRYKVPAGVAPPGAA